MGSSDQDYLCVLGRGGGLDGAGPCGIAQLVYDPKERFLAGHQNLSEEIVDHLVELTGIYFIPGGPPWGRVSNGSVSQGPFESLGPSPHCLVGRPALDQKYGGRIFPSTPVSVRF